MPSVFLSHSSQDKEFVRELYRRLKRDGVDCFFDTESIGWGDNWVRALERALDECTDIVFVLSPDFCNSEWVEVERTSSISTDPSGKKCEIRPLMLRPCGDLPNFPRFLRQFQTFDVSTHPLFEANYPKICQTLGGVVIEEFTNVDRTKLPPERPLPARFRMPYRSLGDKFVGRTDALWQIYDALHRDSTTILQGVGLVAGTGGLGKTQTAIEYVHRFGGVYRGGVYWVDADRGLGTLISQVSEAAGIEIDKKAPAERQLAQLWNALNHRPPSLLVLDNFPEEISLRPYLPIAGQVHTLVTTRRRDVTDFPLVLLDMLSIEAGFQLLNSGKRQLARPDAERLVARLGGLPLALELTKSFLNYRPEVSVPQVTAEMDKSGEIGVLHDFIKSYRDELPSKHEMDVAQTFQLSWDLAPETGKLILRAMAELAPLPVPRKTLRLILEWKEPTGLKDELGESLSELARLSLVELDRNNNPLMHRLTHAFVRYRNETDHASPFARVAAVVLEEMGVSFSMPSPGVLRELDLVVPHAEILIASNRLSATQSVDLLGWVAEHHRALGRFVIARKFASDALESAEKLFRLGDSEIAARQSNLANVLHELGQLKDACDLQRNAVASAEKALAPGHVEITRKQSNLAITLRDLGQLAEARKLLREVLAADKKRYPSVDLEVARDQSNLATVLRRTGQPPRLEEARNLLTEALDWAKKNLPPEHSLTSVFRSNLALVLRDQGRLEEARKLLEEALAVDQNTLDPGHPSIAKRQSNLGVILQDLGQLEKARSLLDQAVASAEKTLPAGHPDLVLFRSNLAGILRDLEQKVSSATNSVP